SVKNLNEAFQQVKQNNGSAGLDNMSMAEAEVYIQNHHKEFINQIRHRTYQPKPVLRVEIPNPNGGKRLLGIPTVVDRVIQQAIAQVLIAIFEATFHETSCVF